MWLTLLISVAPVIATSFGFLTGATIKFILAYFHIFDPDSNVSWALGRYIVTLIVMMFINGMILSVLLSFQAPIWPAQILTTLSMTVFVFLAYKIWVFR